MTVKGIDLNMKWNDYDSDTLYLWNKDDVVFIIQEGTGVNLLEDDIDKGYKDYWMTEWYVNRNEVDGGQWMEKECIKDIDYTIQGVIDRISECDLWDTDWVVLDNEDAELLIYG